MRQMTSAFQKRSHAYAWNSDNIKTNEQGLQLLPKYRPMKTVISSWLLFRLLFQPTAVFAELSETRPEPHSVFLKFVVFSVISAVPGMTAGVYIAAALIWPALDFRLPWLSFNRLRPCDTPLRWAELARCPHLASGWTRHRFACSSHC